MAKSWNFQELPNEKLQIDNKSYKKNMLNSSFNIDQSQFLQDCHFTSNPPTPILTQNQEGKK